MASVTAPTPGMHLSHDEGARLTWKDSLRVALTTSGAVYILKEVFDPEIANHLLKLDCVPTEDKRRLKSYIKRSYKDQQTGLQTVDVQYDFSQRCKSSGIGRLYGKQVCLANLTRDIRNAICNKYYIDFDISNSHPVIIQHIATLYGWACDYLTTYINQREEVLAGIVRDYDFLVPAGHKPRDEAKRLVLAVINSGAAPPS